jgi:peptidoglycan endopeptidase LytF
LFDYIKSDMCKNLFVTFLFSVFCFVVSLAQETHEVKNGETLYSVSKQYNVSTSEIIKANPSAKRGLRRGMSIVIPILHESIDTVIYILHSVRPLESFYSIKNKYGTTQEVLLEFNPQLVDGFRSGMTIKIPQFDEVDVTEKIESTPENEAVSYLDELKERKSKFKKKEVYNIAFLLPLYLDKNDTIETFQNLNKVDELFKKTPYALEFYSGAKIAIDSLVNLGLALNVHVHDTKNNAQETYDIVTQKQFDSMDLVIGPFYSKNFKIASEILSRRGVPTVAPLSTKGNLLEKIPNSFQVQPTKKRQVSYMSEYILEKYSESNILLVRKDSSEEKMYSDWMLSSLTIDSLNFKEILVDSKQSVIDSIYHELDSMAETNVILVPSLEKDFVTDLLTKLNATRDTSIVVFGMPDWYHFNTLDYDYLMNLNVHMPTSGVLSYSDSLTKFFVDTYQEQTDSDPSQKFSFLGFDVTFYFLTQLMNYGGIASNLFMEPMELLNLNFDFNYQRNQDNGSRNQSVQIIKYEDLNIIRVDD